MPQQAKLLHTFKLIVVFGILFLTLQQALAAPTPRTSRQPTLEIAQAAPKSTAPPPTFQPTSLTSAGGEVSTMPLKAFGLGSIQTVAFSPNGQQALFGGSAGFAALVNVNNGVFDQFFFTNSRIHSVAFSPDSTQILIGSYDNKARLWDVRSGQLLHTFEGHSNRVTSVAFSPDGTRILTGSGNTVQLWDIRSAQILHTFEHSLTIWTVTSVAFSPDGTQILTGSDDDTARLWEVKSGKLLHIFEGHSWDVNSVAFSPDGTQILTGSWDTAWLWETNSRKLLYTFEGQGHGTPLFSATSVAFSPDGTQILTGSTGQTAQLWEVSSRKLLHVFEGHNWGVTSVAFSPDGTQIFTGSWDDTARLWDVNNGRLLRTFEGHGNCPINCYGVTSVAFSPDDTQILTGSWDDTARLWDVNSGQLLHTFDAHSSLVTSVAFSPNGTQILTGSDDDRAQLWEVSSGQLLRTFEGHSSDVTSVAFSPDGTQILTGSDDNTARLWEISSDKLLYTFEGHSSDVTSVAFSPDGTQILTGSHDNTAQLWEISSGKLLYTFEGHSWGVTSVAFSPNGTQILTGSYDNTARLWEVSSGRFLLIFEGHSLDVTSVAFSPNGTQILTGSEDKTARLWDISNGQLLRTFEGHSGLVTSVGFSTDGTQIFTGNSDRTARLWSVDGEAFEPPPPREIIPLTLGETVEGDIRRFAWRDYSFEVDAGRSVVVEVTPLANMSSLNLYSRFGSSTGVYDQWTREPTARGTYELLISPTQSGTYYLAVFGREMTSSSGTFRITARAVEKHFSDVTPRSAGNVGPVTLQLSGLGLVDGMSVELHRAGSSIQADTVTRLSDRSLSARFELNGATLGSYDIRAIWPDGHTETLNNAFEVQLGRGPELTANLVLPEANRRERTYTAWVHYANTGDANMPAPLFVLYSEQSAPIKTPCDTGWRTGSVQLLGVNLNGPANVLPPGAEGKVSASFQGIGEHITFDLHAVEASNMPVNWSEYKASMRPSAIPTDEWDRLWPTLTTRLGNSWAEYLELLGRNAERLREQGLVNYCVADLLGLEIEAIRGQVSAAISGHLLDAHTGSPLLGVSVMARQENGETIRSEKSDLIDGHFTIDGLPDGQYELFAEGYYFDPPVTITIANAQDVTEQRLQAQIFVESEVPEEPDLEIPDSQPQLTVDDNGQAHLVWQRGEQAWYAQYDNQNWTNEQAIPNAEGTDPTITFDPTLIDGNSPGVAVLWQAGFANDAHLQYTLGRLENQTLSAWTDPATMTLDAYGDSMPAVTTLDSGQPLVLWLQRNWAGEDDSDLYYQLIDLSQVTSLSLPEHPDIMLQVQPNPAFDIEKLLRINSTTPNSLGLTCSDRAPLGERCVPVQIAKGKSLPKWIPLIGGKYGFAVNGEGCLDTGCDPAISGSLNVELELTDKVTGSGSAGLSGSWRTDTESCQYVLNEASLDLSVGASGEIPFWKPPVKIPGVTVEVAANISGQAAGTLIWQGGNFPSWPQSGDVELTAQAVPYGKVNFFDIVGADIQGEGRVVARYTPPSNFEFRSWCATLGAEAKLSLLRYSWSEQWGSCTGFNRFSPLAMVRQADPNKTMAIYQSQNHNGIPIESALIVTIDPLVGTGNVYEGNPVLATISNDLQHDGKPIIAKSNSGEILAAWTKDSDQPDVAVGSAVVVASYNGNSWDTPVEIQSAEHFNKQTALAFEDDNTPMLLWSSAPANVTLTSPITDVVEATKQTDIFFSYRDNGTWSTPTALATLSGQDEGVQVAADETGQVMAAWRHTENDQTHTLYSAIWNGSSWSTPATIPANEIIDSLSLTFANGTPLLLWAQGTDGDLETQNDLTLHYATWNGSSWSTPEQMAKPQSIPTSDVTPQPKSSFITAQTVLPDPPQECCQTCSEGQEDCEQPEPPKPSTPPAKPIEEETSESVEALDPNEKVAPAGYGSSHIMPPGERLQYTIYFENVITATAPAQEVFITDSLDFKLDWNTIDFEEIAFDQTVVAINDDGSNQFHTRQRVTDYRSNVNKTWWVDITGILDPSLGIVTWTFRTLDPDTSDLPKDALAGFLPPNDETKRGEGHVTFSISPKTDIPLGSLIFNRGEIVFDTNEAIITNQVFNVIDEVPDNQLFLPILLRNEKVR